MSPRQAARAGRAGRWGLILAFALSIALAGCTLPGRRVESSTATAVGVAVASPVGTAAIAGSPPPLAAAAPTAATPATPAVASPRPATPSPTAGTPAAGRGTASPGGGTPRAGATPTHAPFTATKDEPCHETELKEAPLPEKPATAATIEQAYRCFLLHYVDHATMDHRVLLNGAWDYLAQAGQGLFTADDTAPLALTGDREADWTVFAGRYNALAKKYSRVDPALLARVTIDGMARSLKDNHVAYLEPPQWQRAYAEEIGQNTIIGPGFNLAIDDPTGKFYLHDVYPNTPAAAAGLKAGDIIVQVGGRPAAKGTGNNALFDLLTGPVGTSATLQVTRPSTGQTVNARVTVAEVEVPLITSRVLPGGIGYLRLRNFSNNAGEEFDKALAALQAQGITALIFDVRQNPGGSVDALKHILSHFTHQGPLAVTYDENKKRAEENPDPSVPLLGLPWLVLCDNGSASSSDITSAVAKDRGGHLVGEKSAGALGGAEFYELEDGSTLEITIERVHGPNDEEINEVGVTPDHVITLTPADLSADNDPQLTHAIADLTK